MTTPEPTPAPLAIVGFDYDAGNQASYRAVFIAIPGTPPRRFATGDPAQDWEAAGAALWRGGLAEFATLAPSVEQFVADGDAFVWREDVDRGLILEHVSPVPPPDRALNVAAVLRDLKARSGISDADWQAALALLVAAPPADVSPVLPPAVLMACREALEREPSLRQLRDSAFAHPRELAALDTVVEALNRAGLLPPDVADLVVDLDSNAPVEYARAPQPLPLVDAARAFVRRRGDRGVAAQFARCVVAALD